MTTHSRRLDVEVFKDEPLTREEWQRPVEVVGEDAIAKWDALYREYLEHFQPYRWHAKAMNGEILSNGERYFNETDAWDNVALNFGDDTTVYAMPMYGEDRGERLMRFGKTDLQNLGR